jgi:hypothetical protein
MAQKCGHTVSFSNCRLAANRSSASDGLRLRVAQKAIAS